jgi:hypothetical protein
MSVHYGDKETMSWQLAQNLRAITGMQKVDRQHYENFANYAYPSAFLNDLRESRQYFLKDVIKVVWSVSIVAFDYSEGEGLSTKLNSLLKLVKAKIGSDPTLQGQCYTTKITSVDTDRGFLFPHCVGIFILEIMYLEGGSG